MIMSACSIMKCANRHCLEIKRNREIVVRYVFLLQYTDSQILDAELLEIMLSKHAVELKQLQRIIRIRKIK